MFERVNLTNFRKFDKFSLRMSAGNILVGPNNSGKSSILDAFRLLDACYRYTKKQRPELMTIEGEGVFDGFRIPEHALPFRLANATHNYNADDAIVEFWLVNKTRAAIRLHPDRQTRFYVDRNQERLLSGTKFRAAFPLDIVIVPTLAPLEVDEPWVEDATVQRNAATRLASRVLRNIWLRRSKEEFEAFSKDIQSAWPSIDLHKPERGSSLSALVEMYYSEDRIDREVQWSGFGFQVWLQIQTHLRRGTPKSTLIIDEPDIYLHPDLQRKLLHDAKNRFEQFVMATHAIEIINEANAQDIVTINPGHKIGKRVKTEDDYTALYRYLGSTENADIARVARAKQVIFVEGKDGRLLRRLAGRLKLMNLADPQRTPIIQLGGVTEWKRAVHAVWAFRKILEVEISAFCIFDKDYRCDEEVASFLKTIHEEEKFSCKVLNRKEIENYLLVPEAIQKAIEERLRSKKIAHSNITLDDLNKYLRSATNDSKSQVSSQRMAHALRYKRQTTGLDESTIIKDSNDGFEIDWKDLTRRLEIVPGKETMARLNETLQSELQVSLTEAKIVDYITPLNIDSEFLSVLRSLDNFCGQLPAKAGIH